MNNLLKNKTIIISAIMVLILLLGTTYAFFTYNRTSTTNHQLIAGEVYLNMNDNNELVLTNVFPETNEEARARNDNYITFTVVGKNTTTNKDLWYEIDLVEGTNITGKTRFNPSDIKFDLTETVNGVDTLVVDAKSVSDFNSKKIWVNSVNRNTTTELTRTYKLRMWLSDEVLISDTDEDASYTTGEYKNSYASIKIQTQGDFTEKSLYPTMAEMCPGCVYTNTEDSYWTTWNTESETPTVLTSNDYEENYQTVITNSGKNYFLGLKLNGSNQITNAYACGVYNSHPFCIEGTSDGSKYSANSSYLYDIYGEYDDSTNTGCRSFGSNVECHGAVGASAYSYGYVYAGDAGGGCYVGSYGGLDCSVGGK